MKILEMTEKSIIESIKSGKLTLSVVGLGRIGLPMGLLFAEAGCQVVGADIDKEKIASLNKGNVQIKEPGLEALLQKVLKRGSFHATADIEKAVNKSDVVIICVPTPLDEAKKPDLTSLVRACKSVAKGLKNGTMLMVESTVAPGTTKNVVKPIIEQFSGLKASRDFGLAFCPERGAPGGILRDLQNNSRVVGGIDDRSATCAIALLKSITKGEVIRVTDTTTAETTKLFENIYRDVNIALANELAVLCEKLNVDMLEIIDAANAKNIGFVDDSTKRYRSFVVPSNLHTPGAGVGGDCIPVNPYYLLQEAKRLGVDLPMVKLARKINDSMPQHVVEMVIETLKSLGKKTDEAKIAILGFTYKGDVDDLRNTPAKFIVKSLRSLGAQLIGFDPMIGTQKIQEFEIFQANNINECLKNADCAVIITDHSDFKKIDPEKMRKIMNNKAAIIDTRGIFDPKKLIELGFMYKGIGRPRYGGHDE
jgi:UDP-N-acetyl-D-mannosaminuronic acid dehydrogenase